ncbi:MAG: universal stress protein [Spirochaetes bacterium]|nr:universal stress protein [Spirochaetota bacterium]
MYRNILLLMDCSPTDEAIINHIVQLAKFHKSRIHLFHVIHAHTLDQERVMYSEVKECFSRVMEIFKKEKINAGYSITEGEPSEEAVKKASEPGWDLIAMATHGHRVFNDFMFGSVSDAIKHNVDKPLLLVRGKR